MTVQKMSGAYMYALHSVEFTCWTDRRSNEPNLDWEKSQKKIRRERRQRGLK